MAMAIRLVKQDWTVAGQIGFTVAAIALSLYIVVQHSALQNELRAAVYWQQEQQP